MTDLMVKMVKMLIPVFAIGIQNSRQKFLKEVSHLDNEQDRAPGDNFPYIAIYSARFNSCGHGGG